MVARPTALRMHPPPIQPSAMLPSANTSALAPGLAEVAFSVRTTVAMAKAVLLARRVSAALLGRRLKAVSGS